MSTTWLPNFIDELPVLKFIDPLGAFLTGNLSPEPVEYTFKDVVKQSGHACPTIAGAYGLVLTAMKQLYPNETPVRGQISVRCPDTAESGSMGPLSQAISFLTGAAAENGFKGLAGRFVRRGLLSFSGENNPDPAFHFTRLDTNQRVSLVYRPELIPGDPSMGQLLQKILSDQASPEEEQRFGALWQERVRFALEKEENRKELFQVV